LLLSFENGLLITENSGGISVSKKKALVILGERSERLEDLEMIGTWGEAFLYSIYILGQAAEILSESFCEFQSGILIS